jgi:hypothetical protein
LSARTFLALAATVFGLVLANAAAANDSTAELGVGGLVYVTTDAVEMRSEDLFISMQEVRVRYEFVNTSDHDVTTLVAFPMPDIKGDIDFMVAVPVEDSDNFLGFRTTVDGQPVDAKIQQRVSALGVDQTALLKGLNVPLPPQGQGARAALDKLPQETWDRLISLGLAAPEEYDAGNGMERHLAPMWLLSTTYYWEQVFPAGKTVVVEHGYKPSVGTTAGVSFGYEGSENEAWYKEYFSKYCIDDDFLRAYRKTKSPDGSDTYYENRIDYILTTASNWVGNIGKFHVVIDKGSPKNLVSFCGEDVKKISPTEFEMTKDNFYPERDLAILILAPISQEQQ